jgi:hypothetical protein
MVVCCSDIVLRAGDGRELPAMIPRGRCIFPECREEAWARVMPWRSHFCRRHWFGLPLPVRVLWWEETDYGKREPTPELVAKVLNPELAL